MDYRQAARDAARKYGIDPEMFPAPHTAGEQL